MTIRPPQPLLAPPVSEITAASRRPAHLGPLPSNRCNLADLTATRKNSNGGRLAIGPCRRPRRHWPIYHAPGQVESPRGNSCPHMASTSDDYRFFREIQDPPLARTAQVSWPSRRLIARPSESPKQTESRRSVKKMFKPWVPITSPLSRHSRPVHPAATSHRSTHRYRVYNFSTGCPPVLAGSALSPHIARPPGRHRAHHPSLRRGCPGEGAHLRARPPVSDLPYCIAMQGHAAHVIQDRHQPAWAPP